jgi:hypothetical protein
LAEEVKKEAFARVAYERNAKRLLAELDTRDAVAAMRLYADEIDARAAVMEALAAQAAREWAAWIRGHAERTDPQNAPLRLEEVTLLQSRRTPVAHVWLEHHGPYRH